MGLSVWSTAGLMGLSVWSTAGLMGLSVWSTAGLGTTSWMGNGVGREEVREGEMQLFAMTNTTHI